MRLAALLFVLMTALGAARAEAITVREIIELSKSGLGDEVLLALIEIERKVFPVDSATLKLLKDSGVSERVMLAMIRSSRERPAAPEPIDVVEPPPAPQPQVVVIDRHDHHPHQDVPRTREVPVPVFIAVPVYMTAPAHVRGPANQATAAVPTSSIGVPHGRIGLSPPPPRPTSDPPGWPVK